MELHAIKTDRSQGQTVRVQKIAVAKKSTQTPNTWVTTPFVGLHPCGEMY